MVIYVKKQVQSIADLHRQFNELWELDTDYKAFALHQALAEQFPGRFSAVSPAAVELHCTLDLLRDAPVVIALSPDTNSAKA